jgi:hypothetical protein
MNNILEDLKKYFRDTPREKVMSDWAETKRNSPKGGPKLREFILSHQVYYRPKREFFFVITETNNHISPEFTPGLLF